MLGFGLYDVIVLLFISFFSAGAYRLAKEKGRKPWLWAVLCFFFPFCLPLLVFLKDIKSKTTDSDYE